MSIKYISVNLRTIKGIKYAELLKRKGWRMGSVGFDTVQMYKMKSKIK